MPAVKVKGRIFESVFRRLLRRRGFQQAIWAIAHRLIRLIWKILHQGVRYEERGPAVNQKSRATYYKDDQRTEKPWLPGRMDAGPSVTEYFRPCLSQLRGQVHSPHCETCCSEFLRVRLFVPKPGELKRTNSIRTFK